MISRIFLLLFLVCSMQGFGLQTAYAKTQDYAAFSVRVPDDWTVIEQQETDGISLYMSAPDGFTSKIVSSGFIAGRSLMDIAQAFATRFNAEGIFPEEDTLYFTFTRPEGEGICLFYMADPHYIVECMAGDNKEYTRVGVNPKR